MKRKYWLFLILCLFLFTGCEQQTKKDTGSLATQAATKPPVSQQVPTQTNSGLHSDTNVPENSVTAQPAYSGHPERSGNDGGVTWKIIKSDAGRELHVSGSTIPEEWIKSVPSFTNTDSNGNNSLMSQIKYLVVDDSVISIGGRAFSGCTALTDATIGANVSDINDQVFMDCQSLYEVRFTGKTVPARALKDNSYVKYVYISSECEEIGEEAFSGCSALISVENASASLQRLNKYAFYKCTALSTTPDLTGLRFLDESAFEGCTAIKQVTFHKTLNSIGRYAFKDCSALNTLSFPQEGDVQIGNNAFENCSALSHVEITGAVYSIGDTAFRNCSALMSFQLGGQSSMGTDVLSGCSNVSVTVTDKLPDNAFKGSTAITSVTFNGNQVIAKSAFDSCSNLKELNFSEATPVVIICENAFSGCSSLTDVVLCNGLKKIESRAFASCTGLNTITLPKSLEEIGSALFMGNDKFAESPKSRIIYIGKKAEWEKVKKPPQKTGISWNAGLGSDLSIIDITCRGQ